MHTYVSSYMSSYNIDEFIHFVKISYNLNVFSCTLTILSNCPYVYICIYRNLHYSFTSMDIYKHRDIWGIFFPFGDKNKGKLKEE